jgi:hypothetical protein
LSPLQYFYRDVTLGNSPFNQHNITSEHLLFLCHHKHYRCAITTSIAVHIPSLAIAGNGTLDFFEFAQLVHHCSGKVVVCIPASFLTLSLSSYLHRRHFTNTVFCISHINCNFHLHHRLLSFP